MNEIFRLAGHAICIFQNIESRLALLIYLYYRTDDNRQDQNSYQLALEQFAEMDSKTLSAKIKKIETLKMFESKNDINVLEFLNDKRNYLAHMFFVENKFDTEDDIEKRTGELTLIINDANIIAKALGYMVLEEI